MKISLILFTFLAQVALANKFSGNFLGAHIGLSKIGYDKSATMDGYLLSEVQHRKAGLHGGFDHTHRCQISPNVIAGYTLTYGIEETERYENTPNSSIKSNRTHPVNALGILGYTNIPTIMPYITGGLSHTNFKIKSTHGSETIIKRPHSFGLSAGIGIEYAYAEKSTINVQYLYTNYQEHKNTYHKSKISSISIYTPETFQALTVGYKYRL